MKKQLIIATAVSALLASTNLVSGQRAPDNPSGGMSATPASPATPAQPAEKMAPSGGKANSDSRAGAASDQRASDTRSNGMNRADESSKPSGSSAQQGSPQNRAQSQDNSTRSPSQAQAPSQSQSPSQAQPPGGSSERNASGSSQTNVNVNLSADQRTRIRQTVIKESNAPRISRNEVNFNIAVGTVVPRTVRVAALPAAVVSIHPAWRGYSYILVGEEIVIIEPDTLRIVAVIPA